MANSAHKHHCLAVPLPAQGHINPLMRLCETLAAYHDFTITFVSFGHARAVPNSSSKPQESNPTQGLDIRHAHIPGDYTLKVSVGQFLEDLEGCVPDLEKLVQDLNQGDLPVTCMISDFSIACPTQIVADKFNIPRINLYPSSASMLLLLDYVLEGVFPIKEVLEIVMSSTTVKGDVYKEGLPGLPTVITHGDLPSMNPESAFLLDFLIRQLHNCNERAHAMVVNSFEDLEPAAFETLSTLLKMPVYGVGPLVGTSSSLWKEDEECLEWLDKQPAHSVLFISFGSVAVLPPSQIQEIFAALLSSGQRFILVLRSGVIASGPQDALPLSDFLAQTHEQGRVVEWAPQMAILSHPSLGAFLTHCGWNSTMEAITHGVPLICFPLAYDQFLDAKYVEEVWQNGLRLSFSGEDGLVERDELQRVMKRLVEGEESKAFRANATKLKDACCKAKQANATNLKDASCLDMGISHKKNIQAFIHSMSKFINPLNEPLSM